MKKSVIIMIAIIYVASIVCINFFGMKMSVYKEQIPVEYIECTNQTDASKGIVVSEYKGCKCITITYTTPADISTATGTMLQLYVRVYPDNATYTRVRYQYKFTTTNAQMYRSPDGEEKGLILFYGLFARTPIKITSTDGRQISTTIYVEAARAPTT